MSTPDEPAPDLPLGLSLVFGAGEVRRAVHDLAARLAAAAGPEPVLLLGVLKGALFLTVDLARALPPSVDAEIDFVSVSSYGGSDQPAGPVRLLRDTTEPVAGRHVVLVDGIADTGATLHFLRGMLEGRKPASLRTCVLLDKPYRRRAAVPLDFTGLVCPDAFVVGYGLDYQEKYRNLPYLAKLEPRVTER